MATPKVERLINLVIALLSARGYISAEHIRESVSGYSETLSDQAFERMFERDKAELRELGIPIETGKISRTYGGVGYRIHRDAYELPDLMFTQEEASAIVVAGTLWQTKELAVTVERALVKLRAAGSPISPSATPLLSVIWQGESHSRGSEEVFNSLVTASETKRRVRFDYRTDPSRAWESRTLEPWGVVTHRGRWYVLGWDIDRDALRTFRLSRLKGTVRDCGKAETDSLFTPEELRTRVISLVEPPQTKGTAQIWVQRDEAEGLRRLGSVKEERTLHDPGEVLEIPYYSVRSFSRTVAEYGSHAVVLAPEELQRAVLERLRAITHPRQGKTFTDDTAVVKVDGQEEK